MAREGHDDVTRTMTRQLEDGAPLEQMTDYHNDMRAWLESETQGSAYGREYAWQGDAALSELRRQAQVCEVLALPKGAEHPYRPGWHVDRPGLFVRTPPVAQRDREAG
jgi:hypothetical protein